MLELIAKQPHPESHPEFRNHVYLAPGPGLRPRYVDWSWRDVEYMEYMGARMGEYMCRAWARSEASVFTPLDLAGGIPQDPMYLEVLPLGQQDTHAGDDPAPLRYEAKHLHLIDVRGTEMLRVQPDQHDAAGRPTRASVILKRFAAKEFSKHRIGDKYEVLVSH